MVISRSAFSPPCRGGLTCLKTWHLPSGAVDPPARWAATSNVEVGQTTFAILLCDTAQIVTGERQGGRQRKEGGTDSQREGEGRREWNLGGDPGNLREEGTILIFVRPRVPSYASADGGGLPSQGRFEDPVRPCYHAVQPPLLCHPPCSLGQCFQHFCWNSERLDCRRNLLQ